jgi:hypothetical protein
LCLHTVKLVASMIKVFIPKHSRNVILDHYLVEVFTVKKFVSLTV